MWVEEHLVNSYRKTNRKGKQIYIYFSYILLLFFRGFLVRGEAALAADLTTAQKPSRGGCASSRLFHSWQEYRKTDGKGYFFIFFQICWGLVPGFVSLVLGIVWVLGFVFWLLGFVCWGVWYCLLGVWNCLLGVQSQNLNAAHCIL